MEIFSQLTLKMIEKQFRKIAEFSFPLQSALLGIYVYFMLSVWHPTRILALYVGEGRPAHPPRLIERFAVYLREELELLLLFPVLILPFSFLLY